MARDPDLAAGIVTNEPTANRIGELQRLFALVLLRHDDTVQTWYRSWCAGWLDGLPDRQRRFDALRGHPAYDPELAAELLGFAALAQQLGLRAYRWLPEMLWRTFAAEAFGGRVEVTVPPGLPWAKAGKRPKTPGKQAAESGVAADSRIEDLERNLIWFYRHRVRRESPGHIARTDGVLKSTVKHALRRVDTLLACLSQ